MKAKTPTPLTTFTVDGVLYGVREAEVIAVLPPDGRTPDGRHVRHADEDFPLVDPRRLFGVERLPTSGRPRLLHRQGERTAALLVDRIEGSLTVHPDRFQPLPWHFGGREQLWFEGVAAVDEERPLVLVRPQGLLASFRHAPGVG